MSIQLGRQLIATVLLVVCPSAIVMAERPSAMLYANGQTTINGVRVANSMTVFDGDQVDTANAAVAAINRTGSSLMLDPNSSLKYQSDAPTVLKGVARVRTSNGMTTRIGSVSIIPKDKNARYDVSSDGKVILIASREGTLTLTDGVDTATLEPGYSARVTTVDTPAYQDQGPKPAAGTRGEETRKKTKFYIFLGAALAAAAVACAFECGLGGASAVSPVVP